MKHNCENLPLLINVSLFEQLCTVFHFSKYRDHYPKNWLHCEPLVNHEKSSMLYKTTRTHCEGCMKHSPLKVVHITDNIYLESFLYRTMFPELLRPSFAGETRCKMSIFVWGSLLKPSNRLQTFRWPLWVFTQNFPCHPCPVNIAQVIKFARKLSAFFWTAAAESDSFMLFFRTIILP